MFPHLFNQWRGEALSRGEREIRDEVSFQASEKLLKVTKKRATSLKAYRVEFIEPLTEYAGTDNGKGKIKKSPIEFVLLCFKLLTITINAKNRWTDWHLTAAFGFILTRW